MTMFQEIVHKTNILILKRIPTVEKVLQFYLYNNNQRCLKKNPKFEIGDKHKHYEYETYDNAIQLKE